MDNEVKDVQFGDPELMKPHLHTMDCAMIYCEDEDTVKQDAEEAQGITAESMMNPPLDLDGWFAEVVTRQTVQQDLASTCAGTTCPGCGMIVDADNCTATPPDGTTPIGSNDKPIGVYHGGCEWNGPLELYRIEFELEGTEGKRQGVCQGRNPQHGIKTFLENYWPSMGTIVAIRVTGVDS